jgi:hypothetical protein
MSAAGAFDAWKKPGARLVLTMLIGIAAAAAGMLLASCTCLVCLRRWHQSTSSPLPRHTWGLSSEHNQQPVPQAEAA